ncbi:MAG: NrfD/PsrC family molybdoenzyme membrane anchor subunit [Tepidibacillus sp.]
MSLPNETILWGVEVVTYETLATLAAGLALVSLILSCFKQNNLQAAKKGWEIAWIFMTGILFAVPVILGLHLEQPFRSITIFFRGNPTSPMVYGVIILMAWLATSLYGIVVIKKDSLTEQKRKTLSIMAASLGLLFVLYLGFLLSLMKGISAWYSSIKPIQYLVSTLGAGSAVFLLAVSIFRYYEESIIKIVRLWMIIGLGASVLIKSIAGLYASYYAENVPGIGELGLSFSYYGLEWLFGLILPLAFLIFVRTKLNNMVFSLIGLLTVIGAFAEKFNLIIGGQMISRTGNILPIEAQQHVWGTSALHAFGGITLVVFFLIVLSISFNKTKGNRLKESETSE